MSHTDPPDDDGVTVHITVEADGARTIDRLPGHTPPHHDDHTAVIHPKDTTP